MKAKIFLALLIAISVAFTSNSKAQKSPTGTAIEIAADPLKIDFPRHGSIIQFFYVKSDADGNAGIDVYVISPKDDSLTTSYIGEIGPEGGPPYIESVFLQDVNGDGSKELLLLARWEIRHPGIGTSGNYYQTYVYTDAPSADGSGFTRLSDIEKKIGSGLDGTLEGKRVKFPYKDAHNIRALLDRKPR